MKSALVIFALVSCTKGDREKELERQLSDLRSEVRAGRSGSEVQAQPAQPTPAPTRAEPTTKWVKVADEFQTLPDGGGYTLKLNPGQYRIAMTASNDGATIKWVGVACPEAHKQTQKFDTECKLDSTSQLVVTNPGRGFGAASNITLVVEMMVISVP